MAFEFNDLKKIVFLVLFFIIPLTSTTNIDCNGKPYYCVNSTHFMICVDLGGKISTTIDDFVLACPPSTECRPSNLYECEFPQHEETTTSQPLTNIATLEDINVLPPLILGVTTILPIEVTTKSHQTQNETILPVLQENISLNNTEVLEDIRKEFTDGKDIVFETINAKPLNVNHSEDRIIGANIFAKETMIVTDKTYNTNTMTTTEKATSFYSLDQGITTMLPIEVTTKSQLTQTEADLPMLKENRYSNTTEILKDIRKEFTVSNDLVFESINTNPSNVSHSEDQIIAANTFVKETMNNTGKTYSTQTTIEYASFVYSLNLGTTTILPIEVTTNSHPTQTVTALPLLQENMSLNNTDVLEDIRREFIDGNDTVFESITTESSNVSHNEGPIIEAKILAKGTIIDTDTIYSTETKTEKTTSFNSSNEGITTILPIEVTTKSHPTQTVIVFPLIQEDMSLNNTDVLEDIRKEFTDGNDTVFTSITTESSNVTHNEDPIIEPNVFAKETTIDTDAIYSTKATTEKTTSFNSLNEGFTTILPIEVTAKSPLTTTQTFLPTLEENISSNNTEFLADIRKEFTDGKDTVLKSINTIPSNDVSHIEKQIIAANTPAKTIPDTNKIYSTETATQKVTSFYTTHIVLEDIPKTVDITILADNFREANYKDTSDQNKLTKQFPIDNKEFSKKDIDIETSFYPHTDTEQRINLEKPPDYSLKAINQTETNDNFVFINTATDYAIDETRPTKTILKINTEQDKSGNKSDVIETVAKGDNILMINLLQKENITNDGFNSTSETSSKSEENDYIKYALQDEQVKENNSHVNFLPSTESDLNYVSITSTYNITLINKVENNTNVNEKYNFNLKVNNYTKPLISPITESFLHNSSDFILQNGENSNIQTLASTEIPISIDMNITDSKVTPFATLNTNNFMTYSKPSKNNLTLNKSFGNKNIGEELKIMNVKTEITYQRYDKLNNSSSQDKKNTVYQTMKSNKEQLVEMKLITEKYDEPMTFTAKEPNLDTEIITSETLDNLFIKPTEQVATSDILKSKNTSHQLGATKLVNKSPDAISSLSPKNYSSKFDKLPSIVEFSTIFNLKSATYLANNNTLGQRKNVAADNINVGGLGMRGNTISSTNDTYQDTEKNNYTSPLLDVVNNNKIDDKTDFYRTQYTTTIKPRKLTTLYIETLKHSYVNPIGSKKIKPNTTAKIYEEDVKKVNDISLLPAATTKNINKIYVESTTVISFVAKPRDREPTLYTTPTPILLTTDVTPRTVAMLSDNIHFNLTEIAKLEETTTVLYNISNNKESSDNVWNNENQKTYFPSSKDVLLLTSTDSLSNTIITQVTNLPPKAVTVDEDINNVGTNKTPEEISILNPTEVIGTTLLLKMMSAKTSGIQTVTNVPPLGQVSNMDLRQTTTTTDKLLNKIVTNNITLIRPITSVQNLSLLSHTNKEAETEYSFMSQLETYERVPTTPTPKAASLGTISTGTVTETTVASGIKQVTNVPFARVTQIKAAKLLSKAEKNREQLTESTNEPVLNYLPIMVVTNITVSPTTVTEENIFTNHIKLELNKTSSTEIVSLNITNVTDSRLKPFTKVVIKGKVLNIDAANASDKRELKKPMIPTKIMPLLKELLPVAPREPVLSTIIKQDEESLTQLISMKNETETLGTTTMLKTMDVGKIKNRVEQTTTVPFIDDFASTNVTNVIIAATPLRNKTTRLTSLAGYLNKPTVKETKGTLLSKPAMAESNITKTIKPAANITMSEEMFTTNEAHLGTSTTIPKIVNDEKPLPKINTHASYLRESLGVNVMQITKGTQFSTIKTTVNSENTSTESSRPVTNSATEELSNKNVIETTLLKSSTENPFIINGYRNNDKNSIVQHLEETKGFGPASVLTTNSTINEEMMTNSKIARKLDETTGSLRSGNLEFTETSISYKGPSVMINESYLKQVASSPPTTSLNAKTKYINTDKTFTVPATIKATVKETTQISPTIVLIKESGNDSNKFFTTELSQPASTKIHSTENILKSVAFERVPKPLVEPSSAIQMINVTDLKIKDVIVAHKMLGQKDSIPPVSQNSDQLNKYTALYSKIENTALNSQELNSNKYEYLKKSNNSSVATDIKVGFQDGETDEGEEQSTANNYRATTTSPDLLLKNYNKRDISTTKHNFNLTTGPSTNVDHIKMPQSGKMFTEESNTHIYKSVKHITHVLDNHKAKFNESNTLAIDIPRKVNEANKNFKRDTISNKIQNDSLHYTTSFPPYHNMSYTQAQQKLNSSIPCAIHITNPKENLNKSALKCLNRSLGKYADNTDCRKFYICVGKLQPIIGTCPNNTVFSEINRHCTRNLSHCVRNNQFHCLYEGRFVDFTKDNVYFICVKNNLHGFLRYKLQCLKGYHINKVTVKCEKDIDISESASEISENYQANSSQNGSNKWSESEMSENKRYLECKKEGYFPYPKDCTKYYVCFKNKNGEYRRKIKKCSSEKVYDKDKNKCVIADSSDEC